jgi:hypothetical protein
VRVLSIVKHSAFHSFIRWGLGIHGFIHIAEMCANIYERAWISASLSLLAGFLMIAGACIDVTHHGEHDEGR